MTNEQIIQTLAEIKALTTASVWLWAYEQKRLGYNVRQAAWTIAQINQGLTFKYENELREAAGLQPLPSPRLTSFPTPEEMEVIKEAIGKDIELNDKGVLVKEWPDDIEDDSD